MQVQTRTQFEQAQTASVNQLLRLVYALLGLIAASWPARRAARLDMLTAIAAQ